MAEDPAALDEAGLAHARECAACAAYARRIHTAEALIQRALRFDLPSAGRPRTAAGRRAFVAYAAAAAAVLAVAIWPRGERAAGVDPQALAAAVVAHWGREPDSWITTDAAVSAARLSEVTAGQARVDAGRLGTISYARSCYVRGRQIPHLVVQGARGPVMVLLLPHQPLEAATPIRAEADGLEGLLLPFGGGSIALLAVDSEPLEPLRERVLAAVDWTI